MVAWLLCPPTATGAIRKYLGVNLPPGVRVVQYYCDYYCRDPSFFIVLDCNETQMAQFVSATKLWEDLDSQAGFTKGSVVPRWWDPWTKPGIRTWTRWNPGLVVQLAWDSEGQVLFVLIMYV